MRYKYEVITINPIYKTAGKVKSQIEKAGVASYRLLVTSYLSGG